MSEYVMLCKGHNMQSFIIPTAGLLLPEAVTRCHNNNYSEVMVRRGEKSDLE